MRFKNRMYSSLAVTFLLVQLVCSSPVSRSSRMVREVYPEVDDAPAAPVEAGSQAKVCIVGDVVYGIGESVPSEQPCLKCTCNAPGVDCETVTCHQQPGCKAIHKPNKCCPDYQCECHHEGKTYANGEKLPQSPGNECHVCYCRGGEVQCAEVGCYTRDDCEPSRVPGQCCPKYDHCPPREPLSDRIQYTTEPASVSKTDQDLPTTWAMTGSPEIYNSTIYYPIITEKQTLEIDEGSGDESSEISTSNSAFVTNEAKAEISTPITFSIREIESKKKQEQKINAPNTLVDKSTQTEDVPKITIQEVIPQRTEYQIIPPKDSTTIKSPIKIIEDTSNELIDSQSYASEKTEVYDHPPPVLRIGDQLLFFKQGQLVPEKDASTPSPVITLIGAEGLQIGVGSEEIVEHELLPEDIITAETSTAGSTEEKVSSEEYIIKEILPSSTENTNKLTTLNTLETVDIPVTQSPVKKNFKPIKRDHVAILNNVDSAIEISSTPLLYEPITIEKISEEKSDSAEFIPEENPYYPPLPEDLLEREDDTEPEENMKVETTTDSIEVSIEGKKEKQQKELKNESTMMGDEPASESSESASKEDILEAKKHIHVHSNSRGESEEVEKKEVTLADPEISSSEENSSEEQKDEPMKEDEKKEMGLKQKQKKIEQEKEEGNKKELKKDEVKLQAKIVPDVLIEIANETVPGSTEKPAQWLKNNTEKDTKELKYDPPLMNQRAALPKEILEMPAETDIEDSNSTQTTTEALLDKDTIIKQSVEIIKDTNIKKDETDNSAKITQSEINKTDKDASNEENKLNDSSESKESQEMKMTTLDIKKEDQIPSSTVASEQTDEKKNTHEDIKSPEIMSPNQVTKITTELDKSKETIELSEESSSKEVTTSKGQHVNLMANDDASVETIKDSSQMDTSELVETVPGFEATTEKSKESDEELSDEENSTEVHSTHPKNDVETIEVTSEKTKEVAPEIPQNDDVLMEEKQKRNVVKKVLKDPSFPNPTENIQTELEDDAPKKVLEELEKEHSQEHSTEHFDGTTEQFDSEVKIEDEFGDNPTKMHTKNMMMGDEPIKTPEKSEVETIKLTEKDKNELKDKNSASTKEDSSSEENKSSSESKEAHSETKDLTKAQPTETKSDESESSKEPLEESKIELVGEQTAPKKLEPEEEKSVPVLGNPSQKQEPTLGSENEESKDSETANEDKKIDEIKSEPTKNKDMKFESLKVDPLLKINQTSTDIPKVITETPKKQTPKKAYSNMPKSTTAPETTKYIQSSTLVTKVTEKPKVAQVSTAVPQPETSTSSNEPSTSDKPKETEVIQRVGDVSKFRESAENLDTSLIGIFREFISKTQLRYANNAEENL